MGGIRASNTQRSHSAWVLALCLAVLGPLATVVALGVEPSTFFVDSRRTYLRTNSDSSLDALKIDLALLGIVPGNVIRLERLGAWDCGNPCIDNVTAMGGVFSAGTVLSATNQAHRVPGAIDAGADVFTGPTFFGTLPTDIPQDFLIENTIVQVPAGATHLFVAPLDSLYFDNSDPNGDFRIRISLVDTTAPLIVPTVVGTLGGGGWYVSDVTVSWSVTDPESAITSASGCGTTTLTADTSGTTLTCTATSTGGTSAESVVVMIDRGAPIIDASRSPAANEHGWNNTDVTVSFDCSDVLSGIDSCPSDATLTNEGAGQSVTGTATDVAGNESSEIVDGINIDKTSPTVEYSGNAGMYTIDQQIEITCTAADALSGLDSETCADVSGPASAFPLGTNTFSSTATDLAGNTGAGSTTFTVVVTLTSLCDLTRQFADDADIAQSLCVKLEAAQRSEERGNLRARTGQLGAFANEVEAQRGKAFTPDEAELLLALGAAL